MLNNLISKHSFLHTRNLEKVLKGKILPVIYQLNPRAFIETVNSFSMTKHYFYKYFYIETLSTYHVQSQEERYNTAKQHFRFGPVSKPSPNIPDVKQDFSCWEENTSLRYGITDTPNRWSHSTRARWTLLICTAKHIPAKATKQVVTYFWASFN